MTHPRLGFLAWAVTAVLLAVGCGGGGTDAPGSGTLRVLVATTGAVPDPDGYRLIVDRVDRGPLAVTDSVELTVTAGDHAVSIAGTEVNCAPQGAGAYPVRAGGVSVVS